jgi:hypothetical protein
MPYNEIKNTLPTNLDKYECIYKNCVLINNPCIIHAILCHRFYTMIMQDFSFQNSRNS